MPIAAITCQLCGTSFLANFKNKNGVPRRFCSVTCRNRWICLPLDQRFPELREVLALLFPDLDTYRVARLLGLDSSTVTYYAERYGLEKSAEYLARRGLPPPHVMRRLLDLFPIMDNYDLAWELGLTWKEVRRYGERLHLKKNPDWQRRNNQPVWPSDPLMRDVRRLRVNINRTINRRAKETQ